MTMEIAKKAEKKPLSWLGRTLILFNLALALLVAWGLLHFGSLGAARAYLQGDRLIPDTTTRSFGILTRGGEPKMIVFLLKNYTDQPIQVLGTRSTCTCAAIASELPITIPASESRPLTIHVRPLKSGWKRDTLHVYTNDQKKSELLLQVVGQVREPIGPSQSAAPAG